MPLAMAEEGDNMEPNYQGQGPQFTTHEKGLPFAASISKVMSVLGLMALSHRLPLRTKIGFDRVKLSQLAGVGLLMLGGSWFLNWSVWSWIFGATVDDVNLSGSDDASLKYYAFVVLALGLWQYVQRKNEERAGHPPGGEPHTCDPGVSRLRSFVPLEPNYINCAVEPVLGFLVGALLYYRLDVGLLGMWLMLSAIALCIVEVDFVMQVLRYDMAMGNIRKQNEGQAEREQARKASGVMKHGGADVVLPVDSDAALDARIAENRLENRSENSQMN